MPQTSRVYTNKDVEKYLPAKEQNPPDILDDINDVVENDFSPPDILDDESSLEEIKSNPISISNDAADTFWEGFANSYKTGEAQDVNTRALKGYAKGAINLPKTIMGMVDTASSLYNNPMETIRNIPSGIVSGIKGMYDTTRMAGSNPEAFGEMLGESTGQPLLTAGMAKAAPSVISKAGRGLQNYPLTDWVPGSRFVIPPAVRRLDKNVLSGAVGRGIEKVGNMMRGKVKAVDGKIVEVSKDSPFVEGELVSKVHLPANQKSLPPSKVFHYGDEAKLPKDNRSIRERIKEIENLPDEVASTKSQSLDELLNELMEGQELPKPRRKVNVQGGTYTDKTTGEILKEPMNKNSQFFKRNQF